MAAKRGGDAWGLSRRYRLAPIVVGDAASLGAGRWSLEPAWDGHRVLAIRAGDDIRIVSADFREWRDAFPGVALALRRVAAKNVVLEGFLCALDAAGRPSFELLKLEARAKQKAARLVVWDVLHHDGDDWRQRPLVERRGALADLVAPCGAAITVSSSIGDDVDAVLAATRAHGLPGVFARLEDGAYPSPDDPPWVLLPHGEVPEPWTRSLSPPPVVTNEQKVMYPRDGITKRDVIAYYDAIADVMLPHLHERPVVCQRWPDGIDEFTWYQHRIPPRSPDYLRGVWIDGNHRIRLNGKEALLWMVNQAALTIHGWSSRVGRLAEPDWVVLDLDPGEATRWEDVIEVAVAVRKLLELLELPSVPKTSGQRGLHVLIPIGPGHTPAQAHELARGIALLVARLLPAKVSLENEIEKRGGRLFLDHLQNFTGKTLVMPYSLRAADGAPVSMPLTWDEVDSTASPRAFTLAGARARVDAKGDLAAPLLAGTVKLGPALLKLRSSG